MATVTQDPGPSSWTPINMFAMLRALVNNNVPWLTGSGAPATAAFAGQAGPGASYTDFLNGIEYINIGTLAVPNWTKTNGASILQVASGQISSLGVTTTTVGNLGHANGVILVPAAPAKAVNELVSCVIAMDFLTAAYTGGGNVTVNISGGGAALTGLVNTTTFIQAASDVIIELVPLAATNNSYGTGANGLALVSSVAPTNPGTAAGVINWFCTFRQIPALLD